MGQRLGLFFLGQGVFRATLTYVAKDPFRQF